MKKNTVDVQNAYDDSYADYLDTIPHLFYYKAFVMLSNGVEANEEVKAYADWKLIIEYWMRLKMQIWLCHSRKNWNVNLAETLEKINC